MSFLVTALPLQAQIDDFVGLTPAQSFVRTIEWKAGKGPSAPVVVVSVRRCRATTDIVVLDRHEPLADGHLAVGYMRGRSPAELAQQRSVLESAGCDRVYRDLHSGGAAAWAGLLRALAILRDGDTLMAGPRTLTTMLNELGGLNDAR